MRFAVRSIVVSSLVCTALACGGNSESQPHTAPQMASAGAPVGGNATAGSAGNPSQGGAANVAAGGTAGTAGQAPTAGTAVQVSKSGCPGDRLRPCSAT